MTADVELTVQVMGKPLPGVLPRGGTAHAQAKATVQLATEQNLPFRAA
jgi:hypothetical protein